jgi:uncharacterized protein with von Willebrand factor type A (vWA) domain
MKRLVFVAAALFGVAAPAWAGAAPEEAPTQLQWQQERIAGMDRAASQVHGLSDWMRQTQARAELRDVGQILDQSCAQLGGMARRMTVLADSREFKSDRSAQREIDRFQDRMAAMAREMEEAGGALRLMSEREGKTGDPCSQAEQAEIGAEQRGLERRVEDLKRHVNDLNSWIVTKQTRAEFQETSRDMVQLRERLESLLQAMIGLRQEGRSDAVWIRAMDRFLNRLDVMTRESMEAHESLTQLAGAP